MVEATNTIDSDYETVFGEAHDSFNATFHETIWHTVEVEALP